MINLTFSPVQPKSALKPSVPQDAKTSMLSTIPKDSFSLTFKGKSSESEEKIALIKSFQSEESLEKELKGLSNPSILVDAMKDRQFFSSNNDQDRLQVLTHVLSKTPALQERFYRVIAKNADTLSVQNRDGSTVYDAFKALLSATLTNEIQTFEKHEEQYQQIASGKTGGFKMPFGRNIEEDELFLKRAETTDSKQELEKLGKEMFYKKPQLVDKNDPLFSSLVETLNLMDEEQVKAFADGFVDDVGRKIKQNGTLEKFVGLINTIPHLTNDESKKTLFLNIMPFRVPEKEVYKQVAEQATGNELVQFTQAALVSDIHGCYNRGGSHLEKTLKGIETLSAPDKIEKGFSLANKDLRALLTSGIKDNQFEWIFDVAERASSRKDTLSLASEIPTFKSPAAVNVLESFAPQDVLETLPELPPQNLGTLLVHTSKSHNLRENLFFDILSYMEKQDVRFNDSESGYFKSTVNGISDDLFTIDAYAQTFAKTVGPKKTVQAILSGSSPTMKAGLLNALSPEEVKGTITPDNAMAVLKAVTSVQSPFTKNEAALKVIMPKLAEQPSVKDYLASETATVDDRFIKERIHMGLS